MHADWAGRASYIPMADVDNCAVCHMLTTPASTAVHAVRVAQEVVKVVIVSPCAC